ncbi:hypothetical protein COLO4_08283 [Corchorus olitorius]|uniref:Serine/threonine-protein kinase BSK1-like TPR repeats domain-containing protein n=1 Tax=Corchorus olitorius TaxID=93759 RepID=A0A1R3KGF2_9ROSI|nr:hypothetical protein COLO4_08283 [Corchorus olitorius]
MTLYSTEVEEDFSDWLGATRSGDLDCVKEIILKKAKGANLKTIANYKDSNGQSLFHFAASTGRIHICKYLVEDLKLNVDDFLNDEGFTPLHSAIIWEQYAVAVYLLENGANPNAVANMGTAALHMAANMGCPNLLEYLISKGAEIDTVPGAIGTPLQRASFSNLKDNMKFLLDNHANPNGMSPAILFTPLYLSILNGSIDSVNMLLQAGASPNLVSRGETPLGVAAAMGDVEIIKCLLNAEADPNVPNRASKMPIEFAALLDRREAVRCLLSVTSRISTIVDWSVEGILNFIGSNEAGKKLKETFEKCYLLEKSKGEDAFKKKDYYAAIKWYSEALTHFPPNPTVIYSNRSLCWIRLNKGDYALEDAKCCIRLKPDWPKGYYRVGMAWMLLKDYKNAAAAFDDGCELWKPSVSEASEMVTVLCGKQNSE